MIFLTPISPQLPRACSVSRKQESNHLCYCYHSRADEPKLPVSTTRKGCPEITPCPGPVFYCLWSSKELPGGGLQTLHSWPSFISWPPLDLPEGMEDLILSSQPSSFLQPTMKSLSVAFSYPNLQNAEDLICWSHSLNPLLCVGTVTRVWTNNFIPWYTLFFA